MDPMLAAYADVGDHAALSRRGLFVAEGRVVVARLLEDRRFRVHSVAVTPAAAAALTAPFAQRPEVHVIICEPDVLQAVTGFNFHRGCLALAHRGEISITLAELAAVPRILALEGVGDPDNVGGLFRTALALGVRAVLLDPGSADPLYRKAIRTSMGASLRVSYRRAEAWPGELHELRARGFSIVALTPSAEATPIREVDLAATGRAVVLVGSEGPGLSADALSAADTRIRIPVDPRADSLNVVVAAGIALHAFSRFTAQ